MWSSRNSEHSPLLKKQHKTYPPLCLKKSREPNIAIHCISNLAIDLKSRALHDNLWKRAPNLKSQSRAGKFWFFLNFERFGAIIAWRKKKEQKHTHIVHIDDGSFLNSLLGCTVDHFSTPMHFSQKARKKSCTTFLEHKNLNPALFSPIFSIQWWKEKYWCIKPYCSFHAKVLCTIILMPF